MAARTLKWTGIVAGALVLVLLAALLILEHSDLRKPASRVLSARLGQPVRITGPLDLRLFSLTPGAVVSGLELGDPKSPHRDEMARIERLTVNVKLFPLLAGDIVLPQLVVEKPDLRLRRNASGQANWPTK